jgi:hypothetical protein
MFNCSNAEEDESEHDGHNVNDLEDDGNVFDV